MLSPSFITLPFCPAFYSGFFCAFVGSWSVTSWAVLKLPIYWQLGIPGILFSWLPFFFLRKTVVLYLLDLSLEMLRERSSTASTCSEIAFLIQQCLPQRASLETCQSFRNSCKAVLHGREIQAQHGKECLLKERYLTYWAYNLHNCIAPELSK